MNRIKQFIRCITAKLNNEDELFIDKYLNNYEKNLLYKLPIYDIKHSVNVARDIDNNTNSIDIQNVNIEYKQLIKSALLHDIGKAYKPLNPIEKSIIVILNSLTKGKLRKYKEKSKKIYVYYSHGEEGYKILENKGYNQEFLEVIRYHHNYNKRSSWIDIIRKYDDRN